MWTGQQIEPPKLTLRIFYFIIIYDLIISNAIK